MFVFLKDIKKSVLIVFTVLCLNGFFLSCSEEGFLEKFLLENIVEYTVTFNSVEGSSVDLQTVKEGSRVTKPDDPIRDGYEFLAWTNSVGEGYDFSITAVTNDLILGAKWIRIYTVTFNSVDGSSVDLQTVKKGSRVTKPDDPIKDGYEFLAWTNSVGEEYDFNVNVTDDITLTAQWVRIYKVSFSSLNGLNFQDTTVREGSNAVELTDPTRAGYVFEHWSTNTNINEIGDAYDFAVAVSNDIKLYAQWTLDSSFNSFTLTINYNDHSTVDRLIIVASDDTLSNQNLPDPEHPDSAYGFYGWYRTAAAEEGDEYDQSTPITSDVTVYAKWLTDDLEKIVYLKAIPTDLSKYDQLTRNVLSLYEVGAEVEARYVDAQEQGTGVGDKWSSASDDLKELVDNINDASESKVYLVLVTGETHAPAATMGMKNHVAIIGGYHPDGNWERPSGAKTVFDGQLQRRLFYAAEAEGIDRTSLLYDVEIYKGKEGTGAGHGMRLDTASPTLWKVIFNNNNNAVDGEGGGLTVTEFSYPALIDVELMNNQSRGGGALFVKDSSVILSNVKFTGNQSRKNLVSGGSGAMYVLIEKAHHLGKYPDMILDGVTFSANEGSQGAGLAIIGNDPANLDNDILPITVKNVEFEGNTATKYGGGIYIKNLNAFFENITFANNKSEGRVVTTSSNHIVKRAFPLPDIVNTYTVTTTYEGFGGAISGDAAFLTFVNATFYGQQARKGSMVFMENTAGDDGQAPHLKFINVTASGNISSESVSGHIYLSSSAFYKPTRQGSSVWLINSIFADSGDKPLVYIYNEANNYDYGEHNINLLYSTVDKGYAALNEPSGSAAIKSLSGSSKIRYFHYEVVNLIPILGMLNDNGGRVRTMSLDSQHPEIDDGGLYIQWKKDISRFYYSENNSHWYADINGSGLNSQISSLPMEAEKLNYTDARGFDRVGKPGMGAFENQ